MKKVLIIEDDFYIRQMYTQAFLNAKYDVHCATNGTEAMNNLKKNLYDLILLDLMLPGVNGMEILKTLKLKESKNKKSIVFVMTNNDDSSIKNAAFDNGATKYFVKANVLPSEMVQSAKDLIV